MKADRIVRRESEVDARLREFGVTRAELIEVVQEVVARRADAIDDDPLSAEGLFAYIFGTRAMRRVFRKNGWLRQRLDNIESVRHPDRNLTVVYQSVDIAADLFHQPRAVSGKGAGSDRMISGLQGTLFTEEDLPSMAGAVEDLRVGAWFLCVSVDGDDVRAELSLPASVTGRNFGPFLERIFIVGPDDWKAIGLLDPGPHDAIDFKPVISRK